MNDLSLTLYYTAGAIEAAEHAHPKEAKECATEAVRAALANVPSNAHFSSSIYYETLLTNARKLKTRHPREATDIVADMLDAADRMGMEQP